MRCYQVIVLFLALLNHSQGFLFKKRMSKGHHTTGNGVKAEIATLQAGFQYVPLTDKMKQEFVDAHNLARSNVEPPAADMQVLEWDDEIAEVSKKIVRRCEFKHSASSERTLPGYPYGLGENIFVGMSRYHSHKPGYMTQKWDEERKYYNYDDLTCLPNKMCGHYTQVVWSSTTKIGCAIAVCPSGIKYTSFSVIDLISICHYGPPGNWRGRKPYKVGDPCSACPANANYCENGLCSPS